MEKRFNNIGLRNDSMGLLKNVENIGEVKAGNVSGNSIEVEFLETATQSSYLYYNNKDKRDEDFEALNEFLLKKN
jgi:hypothetical protein